ncbi:MAG: hypothetical protein ACC707_12070 [Thiohalomonadales bacterium]
MPIHKRGYFPKIDCSNASMHSQHKAIHGQKAYRFFKAQHILICEHLKNRHNDEVGEIDRLWMGTIKWAFDQLKHGLVRHAQGKLAMVCVRTVIIRYRSVFY